MTERGAEVAKRVWREMHWDRFMDVEREAGNIFLCVCLCKNFSFMSSQGVFESKEYKCKGHAIMYITWNTGGNEKLIKSLGEAPVLASPLRLTTFMCGASLQELMLLMEFPFWPQPVLNNATFFMGFYPLILGLNKIRSLKLNKILLRCIFARK